MLNKLKNVALLTMTVGLLVACGDSEISKVDKKEVNTSTNTENTKQEETLVEEENTIEIYSIGDTVSIDGVEVTVNGARVVTNDFLTPSNDKFIAIDVTIENKTNESYNMSSMLQLSLYDESSYTQDITFVDTKGSLDGEIGATRKMAGEVAYDVTESTYYEFIFQDPFKSGQAIWKINASEIQ